MCLNIGTPKNINFSFETNGKLMALGVPILKHIRVSQCIADTDVVNDFTSTCMHQCYYTCGHTIFMT